MLTSQSGPEISRQYGVEYDLDNVEAVRLVRSGQAEAKNKAEYEKALVALEEDEAELIEAEKDLATTKLADAEVEFEALLLDINDAKAEMAEAKDKADKVIRKYSDKGKQIVKLQAVVDAEIREQQAKEKEALEKVAAAKEEALKKVAAAKEEALKKVAAAKSNSGGGSTKKTGSNSNAPKTLSQMNKGELQAEVVKLEGIKAEEIERVNKLGNKDIAKYIKAYKAPKTSSNDNTGKNQTAASKTATKE